MAEISVIVPVYNAESYLPACLDSILSQTFEDLEIILVNDGSTDRSGDICDEYAARHEKIAVLHQENQGQAAARDHAIERATGEWLCFVDSDDRIHPQMIEHLRRAIRESGAPIAMCPMVEETELPEDFDRPRENGWQLLTMDEPTLLALHDQGAYPGWVACAKLIRRDLVEKHLFCPGRVYEDNEAVCHWLLEAGQLVHLPEAMYFYRTNPVSTTQKQFGIKRLDYLWALENIICFYYDRGYTTLTERFCDRYAEAAAGCYHRLRHDLDRDDLARQVEKNAWSLFREDGIPLTKPQFEMLFDEMHPHLIRLYWPLEACHRRLREEGLGGMMKAIVRQLTKGGDA